MIEANIDRRLLSCSRECHPEVAPWNPGFAQGL
jgi:hypothetical protein